MLKTALRVALFCCLLSFASQQAVHAEANVFAVKSDDPFLYQTSKLAAVNQNNPKEESKKKVDEEKIKVTEDLVVDTATPPQPVEYTVKSGDTLTSIAQDKQTTIERLYAKNVSISDPNIISVGQMITIPFAEEQLTERPLPVTPPVYANTAPQTSTNLKSTPSNPVSTVNRGSVAGNTYAPGYCTWYVKNRRPDLPNRMGNAISWVSSAASQGFATGSAPAVGAVGQQGNHVVFVESVNGDGTVTVSEMNYKGLYVISSRTVSASAFTYIY